jgi:general secretion pathway protein D
VEKQMRFFPRKCAAYTILALFVLTGLYSVFLYSSAWATDNRSIKGVERNVLADPSKGVLLNFEDADIRTIARFVGKLTGRNFVVDESVKGLVTIVSSKPIPLRKVMDVFHVILESHGLAILVRGDVVEIVPAKNASKRNIPTVGFKHGATTDERFVTRLFQLTSADSDRIREAVRPLITEGGEIISYADAGILIVTDFQSNISRIALIINQLDKARAKIEFDVIPLRFAYSRVLTEEITKLLAMTEEKRRLYRLAFARGKTKEKISWQEVRLVPDERINAILVMAPRREMNEVRAIIKKLDVSPEKDKTRIHVYYLKNAVAEELEKVLKQMFTPESSVSVKKTGTNIRGTAVLKKAVTSQVIITSDKSTNALIVNASPSDYPTVASVIRKLDIYRPQVYVEALIMEVTEEDLQKLGVQWFMTGKTKIGGREGVAIGSSGNTKDIYPFSAGLASGTLPSAVPGGMVLGMLGESITFGNISFPSYAAMVAAIQNEAGVNILSTPHLLTMDNKEAEIIVGKNIPIVTQKMVTGEASSAGLNQSFLVERKDLGITLRLTPQITEGDTVRLSIYQEVSGILPTDTASDLGPTYTKRSTKTVVAVKDGETVVIGGLIKNDETKNQSKIPILGDIPLLGWLFKYREKTNAKTNLLVFLTPRIIRSNEALGKVTEEKKESMKKSRSGETGQKPPF